MSLQVGLSASEDDIEVQGEIDFDFFDGSEGYTKESITRVSEEKDVESAALPFISTTSAPQITVSYDGGSGSVLKTSIETVIPSPENYTGNNCGSSSNSDVGVKECSLKNNTADYDDEGDDDDGSASSSLSSSDSEASSSLTDDSFEKTDDTDSMTDVSPLVSHCQSPTVKPVENGEDLEPCHTVEDREHDVTATTDTCEKTDSAECSEKNCQNNHRSQESVDVKQLFKAIKRLEVSRNKSKSNSSTPFLMPSNKHRKNLTFSNDEVRRIDKENQRLLKKIMSQQNRNKPHFASTHLRPSPSAINRQRLQRQIELDNLTLLKRLEAAKPSQELSRSHLLTEYKSQSTSSSRAYTRSASRLSQHASSRSSAHSSGRANTSSAKATGSGAKEQQANPSSAKSKKPQKESSAQKAK